MSVEQVQGQIDRDVQLVDSSIVSFVSRLLREKSICSSTLDSLLDDLIFVWPSRANLTACII